GDLGEYTCISGPCFSLIDYVLVDTGLEAESLNVKVIHQSGSDHFPLKLEYEMKEYGRRRSTMNQNRILAKDKDERKNKPKIPPRIYCEWSNEQWLSVQEAFLSEPVQEEMSQLRSDMELPKSETDEVVERLMGIVSNVLTPMKTRKEKQKDFYDQECKESSSNLNNLLLTVKRFLGEEEEKNIALREYRQARKKHKKLIKKKKKEYRFHQQAALCKSFKESNSQEFWNKLKNMSSNKQRNDSLKIPPPETWPSYFQSLQKDAEKTNNTLEERINQADCEQGPFPLRETDYALFEPITPEEINDSLQKMRGGSAPGPDGIPVKIFKSIRNIIIPVLTSLFNLVISTTHWPLAWKTSLVFPLFKKGSPAVHANYRPISLLNSGGKILEKILDKRLGKWMEANSILNEEQGGFRPGYSTVDRVFILNAMIQKYSKGNSKLYAALIDLQKAFDNVDRILLFEALSEIGLPHQFMNIIASMYSWTKSFVKIPQQGVSSSFPVSKGVLQGSTLSPKLFCIFINDIVQFFQRQWAPTLRLGNLNLSMLLFADDIILLADSEENLQSLLNILAEYLQKKKLKANVSKSKILIFNKKQPELPPKFYLEGQILKIEEKATYLGFTVTRNGKWTQHISATTTKGKNALFGIYRSNVTTGISDLSLHKHIFITKVLPILHYGAEIWGYQTAQGLETLQLQYYKHAYGLHKTTHSLVLKGDLGIYSLKIRRKIQMIKFWLKILNLPKERLISAAYKDLLTQKSKTTWTAQIRKILQETGFSNAWNGGQGPLDQENFIKEFQARLHDQEIQLWWTALDKSTSLTLYRDIKRIYGQETYLKLRLPSKYMKTWIQLRANCLPIQGKEVWKNREGPETQRTCLKCGENDFGLGHFLLRCRRLSHIRGEVLKEGNDWLLRGILSSDSPQTVVGVVNFALKGMSVD
ncbi:MAG: reverse transcriptase family protein, partial [Psychroflexus sp.]